MRFDQVDGEKRRVAGNISGGEPLVGFGDAWVLLVDFSQPVTGWSVLAYAQTSDLARAAPGVVHGGRDPGPHDA